MADAEKILGTDTLRKAYPKLNQAIDLVNNFQKQIDEMAVEGSIDPLTRQALVDSFGNIFDSLKERLDTSDVQLAQKAAKDEVFTMANMGQDIKTAMTGGSVAVVGVNAVLRTNVTDKSISADKTDFATRINMFDVSECSIGQTARSTIGTDTKDSLSANVNMGVTKVFPVNAGEIYSIALNNSALRLFYSADGVLREISNWSQNGTFTVTNNTTNPLKFMRINFNLAGGDYTKNMIVKGATVPVDYIPPSRVSMDIKEVNDLKTTLGVALTKTSVTDVNVPNYVYGTVRDVRTGFDTIPQLSASLYVDHMVKDYDNITKFTNPTNEKGDRLSFDPPASYDGNTLTINNGQTVYEQTINLNLTSASKDYTAKTTKFRTAKASASNTQYPKVLFIGDSITDGVGASASAANKGVPFWGYARQLFEMDRIDSGNSDSWYNFLSLGATSKQTLDFTYNGVHKTIKASANGQAGWMLANHLYHQDQLRPSQATWDLLGLGNGSGTDYTGTAAQITKILTTGQNFAGVPVNPFFDNSKTSVKFSILKMIERYRTRDDNGNKLTLGAAGLGTMITTQQMLDEIDVCTPTHVVIQHGRNDLTYGSINDFITNLQTMISIIRTELPSVKIGLCLTPDRAGTYFTDRYPEIEFNETLSNTRIEYDAVKQMNSIFTDGTNGVYLIPNYYVAPTAYGYCLQDISSPTYVLGQLNNGKRYKPLVSFPNSHPGIYAHMEWAYQVYSWLKYVMAVS